MTFSSLLFPFFLAIAFAFCGCIKSKVDSQKLNYNQTSREKVLLVSAEQTGVFNTGGLGHTVASLAQALEQGGIDTDVLMPFYSEITPTIRDTAHRTSQSFTVTLNALPGRQGEATFTFDLYSHDNPQSGVRTWLLKHEGNGTQGGLFDNTPRPGEARRYTNQDEGEAFLAFNKAAAQFVDKHEHTIVNIHDWHAGFVRNGVKDRTKRFLLTISNMGYQGLFEGSLAGRAGMGPDDFLKTTEFYGKFNFLKHGITTSDMVLTVAPNYLREIATARFGSGLEGLVQQTAREFRISAILNGTDVESWNPQRQFHKSIVHTFHPEDLSGKAKGKALLQAELGLRISERTPLVCMTSRIADQKGYAYLTEALATVAQRRDVQFVILGDGEPRYLAKVEELAKNFPGKVVHKAFDADLEKTLTAYSDFFINTPWYEPSGTNQLFAMKNGTIPIVSRVGGLADFVEHKVTGFLADIAVEPDLVTTDIDATRANVAEMIGSALDAYDKDPAGIMKMRVAAMKQDNSWSTRVELYKKLFKFMHDGGPATLQKANPETSSIALGLEEMLRRGEKSNLKGIGN